MAAHTPSELHGRIVHATLANIAMPFQQTFWSPGFGVLIDRFNIPWEVNFAGPS
jgi:PhnB protein